MQGTCSLLLSGTAFLFGLVFFLHQPWADFVWEGGIFFLCKHRDVCTISVRIAGMSCFFIPGSISGFCIIFSVCFVSCRTKLLAKFRSPSSHYDFFWGGGLIYLNLHDCFLL